MNEQKRMKCVKLYDYLKKFSIYELRNIARRLGVPSPTTKKVSELSDYIVGISVFGEPSSFPPGDRKGARPKSTANEEWIDEIKKLSAEILENEPYAESDFESINLSDSKKTPFAAGYANTVVTGYVETDPAGVSSLVSYSDGAYVSEIGIPPNVMEKYKLRRGDRIGGFVRETKDRRAEVAEVANVNSLLPEECCERKNFESLTPCYATESIRFGAKDKDLRAIDALNPLGIGQRALISAPPASGKTALLKRMIRALSEDGGFDVIVLLAAARPEDAAEFRKISSRADVFSTTFDMPDRVRLQIASLAFEHAKRRAESGGNAVVFIDGMTDLALASPERPKPFESAAAEYKKFFALARNCEEGGSLTVIAAVRVSEDDGRTKNACAALRSAANREYRLDPVLHAKGVFPPVDFCNSHAFGEDYLLTEEERLCAARIKEKISEKEDPRSFYGLLEQEPDGADLLKRLSEKI